MISKLTEALNKAQEAAVEERAKQYGVHYASALEGYGDLARELLNLQGSTKALKKDLGEVVCWVGAQDLQELHKALVLMLGKAETAAYDAIRMCAAVRTLLETIRARTGGDLLDYLAGQNNKDE